MEDNNLFSRGMGVNIPYIIRLAQPSNFVPARGQPRLGLQFPGFLNLTSYPTYLGADLDIQHIRR